MSEDEPYELNPRLLEPITQFVVRTLKPDLFGVDGDHPAPEEEIREALQHGGGYIKVRDDRNCFLVVTHRNGRLLVHTAHVRAVMHHCVAVAGFWDDSAILDRRRKLIGLDEVGLLVELDEESSADSLDGICTYGRPDPVPPPGSPSRAKVTLLDMKRIDVDTFIEGFAASPELTPPI